MDKQRDDTVMQEIRNLTAKLNGLTEYVRSVNEEFNGKSSEQRFYSFLGVMLDKLIKYQESKNSGK